ncbi:hypothetical protein Daesc_003335 [Daldinia eschscholtzii]|uniref:CN hydrolase domain-containing protein n=1 Tax=Daldinia eschscholtzii TaxID=292717 RepID=A0AAX6MU41_9PEZI
MTSSKIRLATASPGTQATTKETLAQLQHMARRAAAKRADILLLPEAYLGGYPRGSDFGCKIGSRTAEGREDYLRYFKSAVDLGDTVGDGGAGAGEAWVKRQLSVDNVAAVGGGVKGGAGEERGWDEGGVGEDCEGDGGVHRGGARGKGWGKLVLLGGVCLSQVGGYWEEEKSAAGTERLIWAQGSPATLKAVSTTIRGVRINLAAAICWESYMPLLRQSLYAQNVNLYFAPTADGRDAWLSLMRTVALEGRCFVVSSNMCVRGDPATTDPTTTHNHKHGVATHSEHQRTATGRRNSFMTEDGFEIALPISPTSPSVPGRPRVASRGRRRSIFDEYGNEIALPEADLTASAVVEEDEEEQQKQKQQQKEQPRTKDEPLALVKALATAAAAAAAPAPSTSFISRGGSSIVSPFGDVLAGPQWEDDEGIIYADVDFDDCIRGRLDLDAAGSYSRNDSFKFSVAGLDLDPLPYY